MNVGLKYGVILITGVIIVYLFMKFIQSNGDSEVITSSDRSNTYKVKVIPATMRDEELSTLSSEMFSYLAIVDAGSSGCRAHVYRYGKLGNIGGPLYVLPQHISKKVKPGLSSFAENPADAGASLKGLIDFLKEQVPESDWAVTPIWLKATAGLRMLDPIKSEEVLNSVQVFLSDKMNSPFMFRKTWARIISGNEEGGFGWIAYNYLKKIIGPKRNFSKSVEPYAVIEMGGASAQVSQLAPTKLDADAIPSQYKFSFTIEKDAYTLYTHSYLGYGAEQAREKLNNHLVKASTVSSGIDITDPCLNKGFTRLNTTPRKDPYEGPMESKGSIIGSADESGSCSHTLKNIFVSDAKEYSISSCGGSNKGPHSFGCVYQPTFVSESTNILIFENFYYAASAIGVKSSFTGSVPSDAISLVNQTKSNDVISTATTSKFPLITTPSKILEASKTYCATPWDVVKSTYPLDSQPKDVNVKMCFVGSYAYSFLTHGLHFDKDKTITIQKDVGNSEIEWALGAAYKEAADFLKRTNLRPT